MLPIPVRKTCAWHALTPASTPPIYIAIGAANLLAIGGGSWMVIHGSLTLGQLTSFVMYLGLMIWPMLALAWMFNIVERGSAAYGRIRTMLRRGAGGG